MYVEHVSAAWCLQEEMQTLVIVLLHCRRPS